MDIKTHTYHHRGSISIVSLSDCIIAYSSSIGSLFFLKFKNLSINILKCNNSKFDDDPEVTAYMQVRDTVNKDDNKVFIFNDWTFASSPSIRPFDHPVYDIWLKKCYS